MNSTCEWRCWYSSNKSPINFLFQWSEEKSHHPKIPEAMAPPLPSSCGPELQGMAWQRMGSSKQLVDECCTWRHRRSAMRRWHWARRKDGSCASDHSDPSWSVITMVTSDPSIHESKIWQSAGLLLKAPPARGDELHNFPGAMANFRTYPLDILYDMYIYI